MNMDAERGCCVCVCVCGCSSFRQSCTPKFRRGLFVGISGRERSSTSPCYTRNGYVDYVADSWYESAASCSIRAFRRNRDLTTISHSFAAVFPPIFHHDYWRPPYELKAHTCGCLGMCSGEGDYSRGILTCNVMKRIVLIINLLLARKDIKLICNTQNRLRSKTKIPLEYISF